MDNGAADIDMEHSGGDQINIPGGDKKTIPEEPAFSEVSKNGGDMGCVPSKRSGSSDREIDVQLKPSTGQTKILEYFPPKERDDSAHRKNNEQKKTKKDTESNNRSKSNTTAEPMSDDENDENKSDRQSGPGTRSRVAALSPLRLHFDDSDDEDSKYSSWAKRDISEYRNNYPYAQSEPGSKDNYKFYMNKISSHPDGDTIDNIHKEWFGDYRKLEYHHGYIQWLFPLQEQGLNWSAQALQKHEIESIKKEKKALQRILISYQLMLDFYGFELVDEKTGEIRRLRDDAYKSRFRNLNTSSHNYLRITRILKCLGEFDYEYLKFPFLEQILRESILENTLQNCLRSCKDYWIETLRSRKERRAIRQYARELIEYRNKRITPPTSFCARRPSATTKINNASPSKHPNDDSN